jgi:hypothetical protein
MNNKKFESNNNNNNESSLKRDSFSGRICDDLCEVLLSYLSFEDKIHFECISKTEKNKLNKLFKKKSVLDLKTKI